MRKIILLLFSIVTLTIAPLAQETSQGQADSSSVYDSNVEDEEFATFLIVVLIAYMALMLGIGFALTAFVLFILFSLVAMGIASTSFFMGVHKKSVQKGFSTFIYLTCAIGGVIFAGIGAWVLNSIMHWFVPMHALLGGLLLGLLGGILAAWCMNWTIKKAGLYFKQQIDNRHITKV